MVSKKTSEPLLQIIVQRLLAAGQSQKIILFGSQARGQAGRDSDYDLLVKENSSQPRYRRAVPYRRALRELRTSKDIVVWTPREIAEWENVSNAFITTALREGTVLFHRVPSGWTNGWCSRLVVALSQHVPSLQFPVAG
jgi:uncharacterized protein